MKIETIHESLVNGQRKQMVNQIKKYGLYDFWIDYKVYLFDMYVSESDRYNYFSEATISYHRLTNR